MAGFIVRSLLTGEDIPINFQIIFGGIFGIALGGAGISTLFSRDQNSEDKKKDEDKKKEDEDAK